MSIESAAETAVTGWFAQFRLYIEIAAAVIVIAAAVAWNLHERSIGAAKIEASDAKAQVAAQKLADLQTQHAKDLADLAARKSDDTQKAVDAYAAAHPTPPGSLRVSNGGITVVSPASVEASCPAGASAGPAVVREVQGRDVGPDFDALVQSASRLAVLYAESQQRQ